LGESSDHRPYERTMALSLGPRVVVVGDPKSLKAGFFGHPGLPKQFRWSKLLASQKLSYLGHGLHYLL
jgi:hypothetical protein